jgi:lipopolysaccharide export system permease protein
MAFRTEIVAILSSGVSYYRFLRPFVVTAVFLAFCVFMLLNFILPTANQKRIEFEKKYFRYKVFESRDIHKQIEPGTFIYAEYFSRETNYGQKFSIEKFENSDLVYKLMANSFRYDTLEQKWILQDYVVRTFEDKVETLNYGQSKDTTFFFGPEFLSKEVKDLETMTYFELIDFIEFEQMLGSDLLDFYLIEKHQRTANPFSAIILTLIAVPIASRKVRGGIGLHIGIGIGIGFSYLFFIKVSTTYATNGTMDPMLAVWLPNILYSFIAAFLIKKAQK